MLFKSLKKKGYGSIEYIILLSLILIVSVLIFSNNRNSANNISEKTDKVYQNLSNIFQGDFIAPGKKWIPVRYKNDEKVFFYESKYEINPESIKEWIESDEEIYVVNKKGLEIFDYNIIDVSFNLEDRLGYAILKVDDFTEISSFQTIKIMSKDKASCIEPFGYSEVYDIGYPVLEDVKAYFFDSGEMTGTLCILGEGDTYSPWGIEFPTKGRLDIKTIYIDEGITSIGDTLFAETKVENVYFPTTLKTIKRYAFYAGNLEYVDILNGIEIIEDDTFSSNKIKRLDLPDSLISIGRAAFANNQIEILNIGNSLETISDVAFGNNYIKELKIPSSVRIVGNGSFLENEIESLYFEEGIEEIGIDAFLKNKIKELEIPSSLFEIKDKAFMDNLIEVLIINNGTKYIGESSFYNNYISNKLILPESVETIGPSSFELNRLNEIEFKKDEFINIGNYAFRGNGNNRDSCCSIDSGNNLGIWRLVSNIWIRE